MKKVIELIRVSTEGQAADDRASIPAQRAINRRTSEQHGLQIVRTIEITDVSGANILRAPEIEELLRLIESPEVVGVVAREFSRLMRPENFADYALLQAFADTRTVLYLPEGPIDFSNKMGRLMGSIRAAIAGLERTEILERVWAAKEEKRRRGELAQSKVVLPWGVGYEEGRGFYYKPQAERVREAFRLFLSGEQSYLRLSKLVGVTPRGMHLILRNPIWTGWRVIDKKRDSSSAGRYPSINGRQADRRKIARAPEEVIRVKVVKEALVSECEFEAVQRIMDLKQARHWRSRTDYVHRFTYNGFLTCSVCGEPVQTAFQRRDYYLCRARRNQHRCSTRYMRRERLETALDSLFAERLTNSRFLAACLDEYRCRAAKNASTDRIAALKREIETLRSKRARVIDGFIEGIIPRDERDCRLATLDGEIRVVEDILMREIAPQPLDTAALVEAFTPLIEWPYWTRDQKRTLLTTLVPDIRVADYEVASIGLRFTLPTNTPANRCSPMGDVAEDIRTGTDSLLPSA